ncbi:hypothetical protein PR048_016369 [Dryococelus australis]|uniref:Uncharacterized protein n=1 Tax=Dryococelus australis TaxID=614101 RepID=A0ABQ9HJU8_9NEOP|nr:hypothetical protein PR048_016369 [Dryococelus australis]
MCFSLTESDREYNFEEYWMLEWGEKKHFIRGRKNETISRRTFICKFFLKKGTEKIRVCKRMFLNTLSIGEWTALNWLKDPEKEEETQENDERNLNLIIAVHNPINNIWSQCGYQECSCTSFTKTIDVQTEELSHSHLALSHKLKKDDCDRCAAFKFGNLSQDKYGIHQQKYREAREEKDYDKVSEECDYTMDLQSLLLCPRSNVSSLYYKTKLAVHNFTIFELKSPDGYCFLWNETEGGLRANEFSTIITSFVRSQLPLPDHANIMILYSDATTKTMLSLNKNIWRRDTPKWRWTRCMQQLSDN